VDGARIVPLPEMFPANGCAGFGTSTSSTLVAQNNGDVVAALGNGTALPILWPHGFSAVFDPSFTEVLDASGATFATAGEDFTSRVTSGSWGPYQVCATAIRIAVWPRQSS
jgi:hypothetical protein